MMPRAAHASAAHPGARVRRRGRAGFTLIELMVALTIGAMAVTSIYVVGRGNTHFFHQQYRASNTMTRLRIAMAQIKRDLQRAGYLATPNALSPTEATCGTPVDPLIQASHNLSGIMAHTSGFDAGPMDPGGRYANTLPSDTIVLLGNYLGAAQYPGVRFLPGTPSRVFLDSSWYSFRRDFTNWSDGSFNADAFNAVFRVGRPVRLTTAGRRKHFAFVAGVTQPAGSVVDPSITIIPAVPSSCRSDLVGGTVAPLQSLRYAVVAGADGSEQHPNETRPQLRRQEWDFDEDVPVAGEEDSVVLEYVVEFDVTFIGSNTLGAQPDQIAWGNFDALAAPGALVQDLRMARVSLAARSPTIDPTFRPAAVGVDALQPFTRFVVDTDGETVTGGARVRRLRADIFLGNMAVNP